ncbi:hypothetical protein [Haliangium sp.]|uniref:hypothetical protein n=1 Tax=Haliangium sp. TaxID=2663208 RepID=UPI003D1034BA
MNITETTRNKSLFAAACRRAAVAWFVLGAVAGCGEVTLNPSDAGPPDARPVITPDARPAGPPDAAEAVVDAAPADAAAGTVVLTHSESEVVQGGRTFFCGDNDEPPHHTDNSYMRLFDLSDLGIVGDLSISSVRFGVELTQSPDGEQPARLFFYTLPNGQNLRFANLDLVAMVDLTIPNLQLAVFEAPVSVQIPAGSRLVVELSTPTGEFANRFFYAGFNSLGQDAPSFFAAPNCGDFEPVDLAQLDAADAHFVLSVIGRDLAIEP